MLRSLSLSGWALIGDFVYSREEIQHLKFTTGQGRNWFSNATQDSCFVVKCPPPHPCSVFFATFSTRERRCFSLYKTCFI